MRNLILSLLLVSSYSALACDNPTTEFVGTVKNHYDVQTSENTSECFYQIEFKFDSNHWWQSVDCPVVPSEVTGVEFRDPSCSLKDGASVSGRLIKNGKYIYIE
jgi:hypothetical protein